MHKTNLYLACEIILPFFTLFTFVREIPTEIYIFLCAIILRTV